MDSAVFVLVVYGLLFLRATGTVSGAFTFVNSGDLGDYVVEYDANYRAAPLGTANGIFQLVFFNTTPNAYALAIRMGYWGQAETMRFVWTANRNDLVRENATLKYGTDGNLLLSDADGREVWSTNTSNRGVVGIELRNNGNLVLYDKKKQNGVAEFRSSDRQSISRAVTEHRRSEETCEPSVGQGRIRGPLQSGHGSRRIRSVCQLSQACALLDSKLLRSDSKEHLCHHAHLQEACGQHNFLEQSRTREWISSDVGDEIG